jgi:hypothetical protein
MSCNQIEPDRINIVLGGHMLGAREQVDNISQACAYIALQHEILNADGVNLTKNPEHFNNVYLPFLQSALVVWEGIPRNLPTLRKLGLRTATFRGGYHPAMREVQRKRERDIDFLFYGSITPYRRQLLEQLSARGYQVVAVFDPRSTYRNDLIGRAQVNLAPIQGTGMEHFAYGRVCYLLNNDSLVVVQRCEDQAWLESCFISASTAHWVDVCEQTLLRNDRDRVRDEFCERFRSFPFVEQMQRLLDVTFSDATDHDRELPQSGGLGHEQEAPAVTQTG